MGRWRRRSSRHHHHHEHGSKKRSSERNASRPEIALSMSSSVEMDNNASGDSIANRNEGNSYDVIHHRTRSKKRTTFSSFDRERILSYLKEYKVFAEMHMPCREKMSTEGLIPICTFSGAGCDSGHSDGGGTVSAEGVRKTGDTIWIGGHKFPPLTVEVVCSRPYLLLPPTLSNKERRCVHDVCVHVGLYHESISEREGDEEASMLPSHSPSSQSQSPPSSPSQSQSESHHSRQCIVSIYLEGFDHAPHGGVKRSSSLPVHRCLPWYYRNHEVAKWLSEFSGSEQEFDFSLYFSRKRSGRNVSLVLENDDSDVGGSGPALHLTPSPAAKRNFRDSSTPTRDNKGIFRRGISLDESNFSDDDSGASGDSDNTAPTSSKGGKKVLMSSHSFVQEITKCGRRKVERLMDQPGKCLRNAHDIIDFEELIEEDLGTVPQLSRDGEGGEDELDDAEKADASFMLVDSEEKMLLCVDEIEEADPSEIGFDAEMYNPSKYAGLTCLLQIATPTKDYVIDVLAPGVWDNVSLLAPIFADPSVVKIGHCIGSMDVPSLHRDFGIFVVNAFDTYEGAWLLRLNKLGLASLCEYYNLPDSSFYSKLKSIYQNMNWRKRPLNKHMIQYARRDIHYLIQLRRLLIRDLTRSQFWDSCELAREEEAALVAKALAATLRKSEAAEDGGDIDDVLSAGSSVGKSVSDDEGYFSCESEDEFIKPGQNGKRSIFAAKELRMNPSLMKVITQSQQNCLCLWSSKHEPTMRNDLVLSAMKEERGKGWSPHHTCLYEDLLNWRKKLARRVGTMPGLVCSTDFLVYVVRKRPTSLAALRKLSFFLPELFEMNEDNCLDQLFDLVKSSFLGKGDFAANETPVSSHTITLDRSSAQKETVATSSTVKQIYAASEMTTTRTIDRYSDVNGNDDGADSSQLPRNGNELSKPGKDTNKSDKGDGSAKNVMLKVAVVIALGSLVFLVVKKRRKAS